MARKKRKIIKYQDIVPGDVIFYDLVKNPAESLRCCEVVSNIDDKGIKTCNYTFSDYTFISRALWEHMAWDFAICRDRYPIKIDVPWHVSSDDKRFDGFGFLTNVVVLHEGEEFAPDRNEDNFEHRRNYLEEREALARKIEERYNKRIADLPKVIEFLYLSVMGDIPETMTKDQFDQNVRLCNEYLDRYKMEALKKKLQNFRYPLPNLE